MSLLSWLRRVPLSAPPATPRVEPYWKRHPIIEVRRNSRPIHEELGWHLNKDVLYGYYNVNGRTYEGKIENPFSTNPHFYIIKPPKALLSGPHGACFSDRGKNVFSIHWKKPPVDVASGIVAVTNSLKEVL